MKIIKWKQYLAIISLIFVIPFVYANESPLMVTPLMVKLIEAAKPTRDEIIHAKKLLQVKKDIKLLDDLSLAPFHKREQSPIKNTESIYCNGCHLPLPHSKSLRTRTFMNMHSDYIACESCHFKPENIVLDYRWYDYQKNSEADKQEGRLHSGRLKKNQSPLIAKTGQIKIAPFFENKPVLINRDHPFSKTLQQRWKKADLNEKSQIHAQIHQPLTTKGTECVDCHTSEQDLLGLISLADSPKQAKAIQKNTIANFFKNYKPENPLASGELPPLEQRIKMTDLLN
jgi:RNase P subunit RPR2